MEQRGITGSNGGWSLEPKRASKVSQDSHQGDEMCLADE